MRFKSIVVTIALTIAVLLSFLAPAVASNQEMNQAAVLRASKPNDEINVYAKPGRDQSRVGYGLEGDRVIVLEQVGSNEGYTWDHIRFDNPPQTEGWVRADHLSFQLSNRFTVSNAQNQSQGNYSGANDGYLGDQLSNEQSQQSQPQGYYQTQGRKDPVSKLKQAVLSFFKS